jgi:CDP-diacylglycerol--glycerol-3-phosphate 3-phosphatidyltransferase
MTATRDTPPTAPAAPGHAGGWRRHVPNALTLARLGLTVVFVAVLSLYRFPDVNAWAIPVALIVFVVAALTDALDGYLARRWNVISVFGRIMDPFADKLLVLGAFIMLAGVGFATTPLREIGFMLGPTPDLLTGVAAWMVVVILGRELLVTTIRAVFEGRGIDFSASLSGKLKMIAQSVGVPVILALVMGAEAVYTDPMAAYARETEARMNQFLDDARADGLDDEAFEELWEQPDTSEMIGWARTAPDAARAVRRFAIVSTVVAWCITVITALSAWPYITRAISALRETPDA